MKVYILMWAGDSSIVSVHTTRAGAEKARDKDIQDLNNLGWSSEDELHHIYPFEVEIDEQDNEN